MLVKLKFLVLMLSILHQSLPQTMRSSGAFVLGFFDTPQATGKAVSRKTYYLTSVFTTTWIEAFNFCAASTMSLATFDDQTQLDAFMKMMETNAAQFTQCQGLIIGAITNVIPPTTKSFVWAETGKAVTQNFAWAAGQPTSTGHCVEILLTSGKASVVSVDCATLVCSFACTDTKIVTPNVTWTSTSANVINNAKNKKLTTRPTTIAGG